MVHSGAMQTQANPWRAWRETIQGLTMNEVARRAGISSGRLSIIERGVQPTTEEAGKLRMILMRAMDPATPERVGIEDIPLEGETS